MKTITIKRLIEELQKYPEDIKVYGTWEGVIEEIRDIYPFDATDILIKLKCGDIKKGETILLIDVDGYRNPEECYMNNNK